MIMINKQARFFFIFYGGKIKGDLERLIASLESELSRLTVKKVW